MKQLLISVVLVCVATSSHAMCNNYSQLDLAQVKEQRRIMQNESADVFDRRDAFQTLSCAADEFTREQAQIDALSSNLEALQAIAMRNLLFVRKSLTLVPIDEGQLTDNQRAWVAENAAVVLNFTHNIPEEQCIGLAYNDCRTGYVMDISGKNVSFSDKRIGSGQLTLSSTTLQGFIFPVKNAGLRIPVTAVLR